MFLCLRAIRRECFATELDKCAMQCLQFEAHVLLTVATESQLANIVSFAGPNHKIVTEKPVSILD
jgi:hypothetical protein